MKKSNARRALLMRILVLLLCVSMWIGTTYAWLTDSVTSANNKIVAGNLDIQLLMHNGNDYADISNSTSPIFGAGSIAQNNNAETLWEPGKTQVAYLAIKNNGNLDLKYKVVLDVKNIKNDLYKVMEYTVTPNATSGAITEWTGEGTAAIVGSQTVTEDVSLKAGVTHYFALSIHMLEAAGNEYQGGEVDFDLSVLARQLSSESDGFDDQYDEDAEYPIMETHVTPETVNDVDFSEAGRAFRMTGNYDVLAIGELGEGSSIQFEGATIQELSVNDDTEIGGMATVERINLSCDSTEPVELTLADAELKILNEINVSNTQGKSVLNIKNSTIYAPAIFVGAHTLNHPQASAEFNVIGSYVSCEENELGSTIAIWGTAGVDATIYDSEIHTYSRGWHQSEDANDNAITFQGADHLNIDIQRSNMHLYGARSIINARPYGGNPAVDFTIDDSLIWVVTKSSHGDETLPVWGNPVITDSALIFTKGVYGNAPAVIDSFVYGNPVIHGNYAVVTQCGWATDVLLTADQTLTLAADANVSVYDGAAEVNFVLEDTAKVVLENGAVLKNIGIKAADGYTLVTQTENGNTVYTVTAA